MFTTAVGGMQLNRTVAISLWDDR